MNAVSQYISEVSRYFSDENSSEHSYRTAFQNYLATIFPPEDGYFIQQDAKAIDGNKPDYIILKNNVPLLYIEVKKVGENLDKIEKSNQADRYFGYTNLIISDYVEFRFFRNGQRYDDSISLGKIDVKNRSISPQPEHAERLERTVKDFVASQKEPIKNGKHLAKIMGGKAQRIRDNVIAFLETNSPDKEELVRMRRFIKEHLVENFTDEDFADMYAQTLVYGLFAARYNDDTLENFSRQEARELVPATNPFLKSFFDHISGSSFPRRLELIVDELCEVFSHADVEELMNEYFKNTNLFGEDNETPDPVIHFYEDFLKEYDPSKKMEMGVFYTPLPVVRFIIRGIDELLKTEFCIEKGLADNQKISVKKTTMGDQGRNINETHEIHRVQLLDIATGTGTFLNETVNHIHESFKANQGRWSAYVQDDLLPRLHGFELMMASYTIAHLKLAMTLKKSGVDKFSRRLGVYLSNTLDDAHNIPLTSSLFGVVDSIAEESRLASEVKKDTPIMVLMGNPPYSGESQNPHYTGNDVYKFEPGGKEKLKERNSKWINDDYVKFVRFAESMVEKNSEGIIGMITAHGYIDNPTFRGMRWHLRKTFDKIYVLDLHGNSNKKEVSFDGTEDKNVFDIKTGVSIIFGVKKQKEGKEVKGLADVYQFDLYGKRAHKFGELNKNDIAKIDWNKLPDNNDIWKVEGEGKGLYNKGFSVADLFSENTVGIVTSRDKFVIDTSKDVLVNRIGDFLSLTSSEAKNKYELKENQKWKIDLAQKHHFNPDNILPISYRPFDDRYIYYNNDFIERSREKIMNNFIGGKNIGLMTCRQTAVDIWDHISITDKIVDDSYVSNRSRERGYLMPLYIYTEDGSMVSNLDEEIVKAIELIAGAVNPENVLDYVYAYLHSPTYRATYTEFLKSDFPRVPYPKSKDLFWKLVEYGSHLRQLHLLEHPDVHTPITTFPEVGNDMVEKLSYKDNRVYINETQYWDGVSKEVWEFYMGGYQPAQKYLKDRKDMKLTSAEFENYEKMIVSLSEAIKVMKEIDKYIPK